MKKVKKVLSLILIFVFLLQLIPVSAIAEFKSKQTQKYNVTEIIVKYKEKADKDAIKKRLTLNIIKSKISTKKKFKDSSIEVIDIKSIDNMENVIDALNKESDVEYVSPNYKIEAYSNIDEPMFTAVGAYEKWPDHK